jgi:hypothetical protein
MAYSYTFFCLLVEENGRRIGTGMAYWDTPLRLHIGEKLDVGSYTLEVAGISWDVRDPLKAKVDLREMEWDMTNADWRRIIGSAMNPEADPEA